MVRVSFCFVTTCVGRWSAGGSALSSCGQGGLLLFLVVLLSDHFYACGESGETVYVVAVAVGEDDGGYGLGRNLRDVIEQFLATGFRSLGIDDDYAVGSDYHCAVSAAAFDPVNVRLQLMGYEWCRWGRLCERCYGQCCQSTANRSPLIKRSL